jgi:N utilization substance protein B
MARHKGREHALQMLFQWDVRRTLIDDIERGYYGSLLVDDKAWTGAAPGQADPFAHSLLRGTIENITAIDELITRHASNWRLERMPAVDRNILRLCVYELTKTDTPAAVAIDEALELTRRFAGEESVQFVNGVLDAIRRALPAKLPAREA